MDIEYQSEKSNLEIEKVENPERLSKIMSSFYAGVLDGSIDKSIAEEKQKAIDIFVADLYLKNFDPTEYKLYYDLMGLEIQPEDRREYKSDTQNPTDPFGPGLIEIFIVNNFLNLKKK